MISNFKLNLIIIIVVMVTLFSTSSIVYAFKSNVANVGPPVHQEIIDTSLPFIKSEVREVIKNYNISPDIVYIHPGKFLDDSYHFDNCNFEGATENINEHYNRILANPDPMNVAKEFGLLLHPIQDLYSHSNWVEIGRTDLIDDGLDKWNILHPFDFIKDVYIIQGENREIPNGYMLGSSGDGIVTVSNDAGSHFGLITGSFGHPYLPDQCPDLVAISHGDLNKDEPYFGKEDLFNNAKNLAIEQTKHEWCRLVNILKNNTSSDTVKNIFNSWLVDPEITLPGCSNEPPNGIPNALQPYSLTEGSFIILDGSASLDPNGDVLTYKWVQTGGPHIDLLNDNTANPAFIAPDVDGITKVIITLIVNDGLVDSNPVTLEIPIQDKARIESGRTITVDTTDPTSAGCNNDADTIGCSLMGAIISANSDSKRDEIIFNIPGSGSHVIDLQSELPVITNPIIINGTTQPGYSEGKPVIELNGKNIGNLASGLTIANGSSEISGLAINGFSDVGIHLLGEESKISGNYIGIDLDGITDAGNNKEGIRIEGSYNIIGGQTVKERNIISGNGNSGIVIVNSNSMYNQIVGNFIGTTSDGKGPLKNDLSGIVFSHTVDTTQNSASRNLIGGYIGTSPGGSCTGSCNLISGNAGLGIDFFNSPGFERPNYNFVQGNYIGVDVTGTKSISNEEAGIGLFNAQKNTIGGKSPNVRNIISGNGENSNGDGIRILTGSDNLIQGNFLGVDTSGKNSIGNTAYGIDIQNSSDNVIGKKLEDGEAGKCDTSCNLISGNEFDGIIMGGSGSKSNIISGNFIGTDIDGINPISNDDGITITDIDVNGFTGSATNNIIGGKILGQGNLISGNLHHGISISKGANENQILGNVIGLDSVGSVVLSNVVDGISISASSDNIIGGSFSPSYNVISGNNGNGISLISESKGNHLIGNFIGTKIDGSGKIGNSGDGIHLVDSPRNIIGNDQNDIPPVVSGNSGNGISISGQLSQENKIFGNNIGSDVNLSSSPNGKNGILISDSFRNTVGGLNRQANIIYNNLQNGIAISGFGSQNTIRGNTIYDNNGLGIDLGNDGVTPNDNIVNRTDSDTGSNGLNNFPVGVTSFFDGTHTFISGILKTQNPQSSVIDIYGLIKPDSPINKNYNYGFGEGAVHVGQTSPREDGIFFLQLKGQLDPTLPYLSATATSSDGSTSEFSPVCGSLTDNDDSPDNDGDGLCDDWETHGIDFDGDGSSDLQLDSASPLGKDVFVEVDYMQDHKPSPDAIDDVKNSFMMSPVEPAVGINLHVDIGDEIPHKDVMIVKDFKTDNFSKIKNENFGTKDERDSENKENILGAKTLSYHYGLFVHERPEKSSGLGEPIGNDFVISLGNKYYGKNSLGHNIGTKDQQSAAFMHELGHNFGLRHGGSDDINCKPNYLSVMNYALQFPDLAKLVKFERPLDYSRSELDLLDENLLDERKGIGVSTPSGLSGIYGFRDHITGGIMLEKAVSGKKVDWNKIIRDDEDDVQASINNFGYKLDIEEKEVKEEKCNEGFDPRFFKYSQLHGHDDWSSLIYNFRANPSTFGLSGISGIQDIPEEITPEFIEDSLLRTPEHIPTAFDQSVIMTNNSNSMDIILKGSDPDNQVLNFSIVDSPLHGILSNLSPLNSTAAMVTYISDTGFTGIDIFTFKASDGTLDSSNNPVEGIGGTVTISVNETSSSLNIEPISNAGEDLSFDEETTGVVLNGNKSIDYDGNIIKYEWKQLSGQPLLSGINANTPTITFDLPSVSMDTIFKFSLTVTDDSNANSSDTVNIAVRDIDQYPIQEQKYSFYKKWGSKGFLPGNLFFPTSIGIATNQDTVYVIDGNFPIQKFDKNGTFLSEFNNFKHEDNGNLRFPFNIEIDIDDNLVFISDEEGFIKKFSPDGELVTEWNSTGIQGMAIDPLNNNLFVVDRINDRIYVFDYEGNVIDSWTVKTDPISFSINIGNIAIDNERGYIYLTDMNKQQIYKFSKDGTFIRSIGSSGVDSGQFQSLSVLAVEPSSGDIIASDLSLDRIQKFASNGQFVTKFGTTCNILSSNNQNCVDPDGVTGPLATGDGQFLAPYGLAFDSQEKLYVADQFNSRIQIFSKELVSNPNIPPIADVGPDFIVDEEQSIILNGSTSIDPDGFIDSFSWKQITGPDLGDLCRSITCNDPIISVQAPALRHDQNNTLFTFNLTVTDRNGASSSDTLNVIVKDLPNRAPIALNSAASTKEFTPVNITLSGYDPDRFDNLTYNIVDPPQFGHISNFNPNTGTLTYFPIVNYNGRDTFSFSLNDGLLTSDKGFVVINMFDVTYPIAVDQSVRVFQNTPTSIVLRGNYDSSGNTITFSIVEQPLHGRVEINNPNSGGVIYTPDSGFLGTDRFTFKISNGIYESNIGGVLIDVVPAPPEIKKATDKQNFIRYPYLSYGSYLFVDSADRNEVSKVVLHSPPKHGIVKFNNETLTFEYSVNSSYLGFDDFSYSVEYIDKVTNQVTGQTNIAKELFVINDPPQLTPYGDSFVNVTDNKNISINVIDRDNNQTLSYILVKPPENGKLQLVTGEDAPLVINTKSHSLPLVYTPFNNGETISDCFQYRIYDGVEYSDGFYNFGQYVFASPATYSINSGNCVLKDTNPTAVSETIKLQNKKPITITLKGSDLDGDTLSFSIDSQPLHGSLIDFDNVTKKITYIPNSDYNGIDSFNFRVSDGKSNSIGTITIIIPKYNVGVIGGTSFVNDGGLFIESLPQFNEFGFDSIYLPFFESEIQDKDIIILNVASHDSVLGDGNGILCNTNSLNQSEKSAIVSFLLEGGKLLIFDKECSPNVDYSWLPESIQFTTFNPGAGRVLCPTGEDCGALIVENSKLVSNIKGDIAEIDFGNSGDIDRPNPNATPQGLCDVTDSCGDANMMVAMGQDLCRSVDGTTNGVKGTVIGYSRDGESNGAGKGLLIYNGLDFDFATQPLFPSTNNIGALYKLLLQELKHPWNPSGLECTIPVINSPPTSESQTILTTTNTKTPISLNGRDNDGDKLSFFITENPMEGSLKNINIISFFKSNINSIQEIPQNPSSADGIGLFEYNHTSQLLKFSINYTGLTTDEIISHIHLGSIGSEGQIQFDLPTGETKLGYVGPLTDLQERELFAGNLYVDIHSNLFADGEIRGQIVPTGKSIANLDYIPKADFSGTDKFTFKVSDGKLNSDLHFVDIIINKTVSDNSPPIAQDIQVILDEDKSTQIQLDAFDIDLADSLTYSIESQPVSGKITSFDPSTGSLVYDPSPNFNGNDAFLFKAVDQEGLESNIATVRIIVTSVNDPPVANNQQLETDQNIPLQITLSGSDHIDNDAISQFRIVNSPTNGQISNFNQMTGELTYTPNNNFIGNESFTFKVIDSQGLESTATALISINVKALPPPTNNPPVAVDKTVETNSNTPVSIKLEGRDTDQGDSISGFTLVSSPTNGQISNFNSTTGILLYTPNNNFVDQDTFTFKTIDSHGLESINTGLISINIKSLPPSENNPPVAFDKILSTNSNTPVNITLEASDKDIGDMIKSFNVISNPLHGQISNFNSETGKLTYIPNNNFVGQDSFTFKVTDSRGLESINTGLVTINVNSAIEKKIEISSVAKCDPGESATGGGFVLGGNATIKSSKPLATGDGWNATARVYGATGTPEGDFLGSVTANVICFDNLPLHR